MTEIVLDTNTLPEPLFQLIQTEKVKVNEVNGIISLIPIVESKNDCPLRGLAADSSLTVDKFLALTHDDFMAIPLLEKDDNDFQREKV